MKSIILVILLLIFALTISTTSVECISSDNVYPAGFFWGVATSAYQIEGAWNIDGKEISEPDLTSHIPGRVNNNENADIADDDYYMWQTDINLIKALNLTSYRFSVSWPRIIDSAGNINSKGIAHYNLIIDYLVSNNITPFITLYHGDLPLQYSSLFNISHGFLDYNYFVPLFINYAAAVFSNYGDRVKHYIVFNEPFEICNAYSGVDIYHGPIDIKTAKYQCAYTVIMAQLQTTKLWRNVYEPQFGKGFIGLTLDGDWAEPLTSSPDDAAAAERQMEFQFAWFGDPLYFGSWPKSMMQRLEPGLLPTITQQQSVDLLNYKPDFFAHNHYTTHYYKNNPNQTDPNNPQGAIGSDYDVNGNPIGPLCASPWLRVVPWGFNKILHWFDQRYEHPIIYITENGCDVPNENTTPLPGVLHDTMRVDYLQQYIGNMTLAISQGVDVRGYYVWSLLDNFEWGCGYECRFGIHYVDFNDPKLTRYQKDSAVWYGNYVTSVRTSK